MNYEIKDFIGVFSDVYPDGFCEHLISEFDRSQNNGIGTDRQNDSDSVNKHLKNDYQIYTQDSVDFEMFENQKFIDVFFEGLQKCFDLYTTEFSVLKDIKMFCNNVKCQKTSSGGGYHIWHSEQGNNEEAKRGLVYMLYLNSTPTEANGETEFLYQQRRLNPVENTMVLWPAGFTHPHRGNPVYGDNEKYIATGWFYHE